MEFRVLGAFEARRDGCQVQVGRRLERCLLGILLLEAGTAVSAERLADLLWDETGPRDPRAALHTYVSRLRSGLARGGGDGNGLRLVRAGDGYQADIEATAVDALRFRSLLGRARVLADPAERARALREAVELRRGPLLADVATEGVRLRLRAAWDEAWLTAREEAINAELACGRHHELVSELTGLSAEYPFRDRVTGLLMRALYRCGRTADALEAYARTERRMRAELSITPGADLRDLRASILAGDRKPGAAR